MPRTRSFDLVRALENGRWTYSRGRLETGQLSRGQRPGLNRTVQYAQSPARRPPSAHVPGQRPQSAIPALLPSLRLDLDQRVWPGWVTDVDQGRRGERHRCGHSAAEGVSGLESRRS